MNGRWGDAAALRDTARFLRDQHDRFVLADLVEAVARAVEADDDRFADVDPQLVSDDLDVLIRKSYEDGMQDAEESFDPIRAFS